jgi:hypothetical protein
VSASRLARHVGELGRAAGAGARDRDDDDDDDGLAEFRKHLAAKGLNADEVEEACEHARRDVSEDRLPVPATRGGMGGYRSGRSKDRYDETDFAKDYPESVTTTDPYGEPNSERLMRDFDPVRAAAQRDTERLPGGGTSPSRRLFANDAALATDADLAREYPGIENVGTSMFG